jgi:hypothetical protein
MTPMVLKIKFKDFNKKEIAAFEKSSKNFSPSLSPLEENFSMEIDFVQRILELGWDVSYEEIDLYPYYFPPNSIFESFLPIRTKIEYSKKHLESTHNGWSWDGYGGEMQFSLLPNRFISYDSNNAVIEIKESHPKILSFSPAEENKKFFINAKKIIGQRVPYRIKTHNLFREVKEPYSLPDISNPSTNQSFWFTKEGVIRKSKFWGKVGTKGEWLILEGQRKTKEEFPNRGKCGLLIKNTWNDILNVPYLVEKGLYEDFF